MIHSSLSASSCCFLDLPSPTVGARSPSLSCWEYPWERLLAISLAYQGLQALVSSIISELRHVAPEPESLPWLGQQKGQSLPLEFCARFCFRVTLLDLRASCIPGDHCESKVVGLRPVPLRDPDQREISLESGHIKGAEASFSVTQRITVYSRD